MKTPVVLGTSLTIDDVVNVAVHDSPVTFPDSGEFRENIRRNQKFLESLLQNKQKVYGVTTGYGDSCTNVIDTDLVENLPVNLLRYHKCGLGDFFNEHEARAIQVARLASLVQGLSGVRLELLEFLAMQLNRGISPRIPKEGSVGASGDLTPLAYLAATVVAEGEVLYENEVVSAQQLYQKLNIKAIGLRPKEGLALMNGTAVMTALACLAYKRAEYLCQLASKITASNSLALMGNPEHFDPFLFLAKPHRGQAQIAKWIRSEFTENYINSHSGRLQDRYSIRCAPHVVGVLQDALYYFKTVIETELNSVNDNPLIDDKNGRVIHGGNFYGGHIAFAMDSLKVLVANVADLLDRQLAMMVDPKFNNGLPANLSGAKKYPTLHHGFKAVQIAVSAWTAEALKLCLPASIFSRSTECHNQDKVSMGTIAARDCLRILELTEQVGAAASLASVQALGLRRRTGELGDELIGPSIRNFERSVLEKTEMVEADRPLDNDLRTLLQEIRSRSWELYS